MEAFSHPTSPIINFKVKKLNFEMFNMDSYIKVADLVYTVPKFKNILNQVSFEIKPGEFWGLLGKNGAGKTTLIDILMGYRNIKGGNVEVFGENPQHRSKDMAQKVAYLSHDVKMPSFYSLEETLEYHSYFYPKYDKEKEKKLLDIFELDLNQKIGGLSTGEGKKVQIVAGLSSNADVFIIDEITAFLDPKSRLNFFDELKKIMALKNKSILLATNITEDLESRVDKVLFISDGHIKIHTNENLNVLFEGAA